MKIFDIEINDNILEVLKKSPIHNKGNFILSLTKAPPDINVDIAKNVRYIDINTDIKNKIWLSLKDSIINSNIEYTNCIGYPPNGGMDWHTNSNNPGIRVYVSWSENGNSGMLWYKNNKILIDKDSAGFNIRQFLTPCWHSVWSNCYRYSMGFKINI